MERDLISRKLTNSEIKQIDVFQVPLKYLPDFYYSHSKSKMDSHRIIYHHLDSLPENFKDYSTNELMKMLEEQAKSKGYRR